VSLSQQKLLRLLADGQTHSGTDLALQCGVTRAAVWKCVQQLEGLGIEIAAGAGKGYQLRRPLELLDAAHISAALPAAARQSNEGCEVLWSTSSTNDYLLQMPGVPAGRSRACLAELQTGGRGRRGRKWFATAGYGLCLSIAWTFRYSPPQLGCLGLVAGVAVLRAVRRAGATNALLKWPNDVVIDGHKLAGILIDVRGEAGGPLQAVIGIGLNYDLPAATARNVVATGGLEPVSMRDAGATLSRNDLAASLITELHATLELFSSEGFGSIVEEWRAADYLQGKEVRVEVDGETQAGIARGIAADGRLQLATSAGIVHLTTGDVSVRLAA